MGGKIGASNVCDRKVCYSALFTNLVGWHAGAVRFPPSDVILAQLACPLGDVMFCLHSGPNVIKLFCPLFTDFCTELECLTLASFPAYSNKHSSLVQKSVNHRQKKFKTLAPGSTNLSLYKHWAPAPRNPA